MENPYLKAELLKPGGVASRLAEARNGANLSGKALAHRTGFQASKISKLELGNQVPSAEDVHVWLKACGAALTGEQVFDALEPAARALGLTARETARTIRSGLTAGARHPRRVAA